jgi:hypothetical protein
MIKLEFIDNVKHAWRMWSLRFQAIAATIISWFVLSPDAALYVWKNLPDEFKSAIPPEYMPMIGVAIMGIGMFARLIKQSKLPKDGGSNDA